jgi:hypothetical protein
LPIFFNSPNLSTSLNMHRIGPPCVTIATTL